MDSANDAFELETIVKFWGHACAFSYDPGEFPGEPYAADRRDGSRTIRAAAPALLLAAVRDDTAAQSFTAGDIA